MQIVPLVATPSQTLAVQLADQAVQLNVYQRFYGLFMDVEMNGETIIAGVLCLNKNRIVRSLYLGFPGDFVFVDTQGGSDPTSPHYSGLGSRYVLVYIEASELPEGQG